ncbi:MAG: protein kinase, partial [Anaerolineae bacterium]|nr:protein kinase [Anaerolineae bacterium]
MPRLTISLLGNFSVALDDTPVDGFAYDKVRALLAYLAVENEHPHHREHIADLLWPSYPTRSARQNLSQALSTLRGALGDRDNDPPFLLVDHREIQFNGASDTWLDVSELQEHLDAVQTHAHANLADCAVCRGHLEQATALYRGDFLDDLLLQDSAPFEEWSLLQRESLRRQILDALERLAESYLQRGEADAALHHARRQLALDAWREPAHRQVMRALVLSEQRNAAIAHYEECRRLLAAGLGVEPETATLELAAALKSHTLSGSTQVFAEDARADQVMIGKPVGNYLVVAYLGQGGMAQVYKAYHTRLARYVALKFIRPELLQADALRAFEQEAKTLARLNHPNVVQVYDFGELALSEAKGQVDARQPYLVMEYIAGETLKEWLPEDQPLPLEQVWSILQQISAALDHAHEQGIIHRDVKPGNVMLTPDGHALLSDFGISKLLRPGEEAAYTVATTGTPAYIAPEQVDLNLGPISPATDVYALGIVAYEMLTSKHPFQGVTPISELLQRIQSPPTPPRQYNPALPEAVERVLLTVLSKEPDARYPRAGAFMRALAAAAPELVAKAEG